MLGGITLGAIGKIESVRLLFGRQFNDGVPLFERESLNVFEYSEKVGLVRPTHLK